MNEITNQLEQTKLTTLYMGEDYNLQVDKLILPATLTHLDFGNTFNHSININSFPTSLTCLTLGRHFLNEINSLRQLVNLTTLKMGNVYLYLNTNLLSPLEQNKCRYNRAKVTKVLNSETEWPPNLAQLYIYAPAKWVSQQRPCRRVDFSEILTSFLPKSVELICAGIHTNRVIV